MAAPEIVSVDPASAHVFVPIQGSEHLCCGCWKTFENGPHEAIASLAVDLSDTQKLDAIMESQARLEDKLDGLIEVLGEFMPLLEQVRAKMNRKKVFGG